MEEENILEAADNSDMNANLIQLNGLTGRPTASDVLKFCIPVCAPYSALSDYKYKVKLVPGTSKRGQITKNAMNIFQQVDITSKELDLIKAIPDTDVSQVLLSNVKLAVSGSKLSKGNSKSNVKKSKK